MNILAFDTSTQWLTIALFDGLRARTVRERAGHASSERLLPLIAAMLEDARTPLAALAGIAFGAGPGSFTGLRIACGVAQGLAFGAELPVVAVPTLAAVAHAAWRASGARRVVACLDARMREVYVASYSRIGDQWTLASGPSVRRPGDLEPPSGDDWHGAGDGFAAYPDLAGRLRLAGCDATIIPEAQSIAEWAWPRFLAGEGVPAAEAEPLYVRHRVALTSAERAAGLRL